LHIKHQMEQKRKKENKTSQYQAACVDMLVALAVGICVYNSNSIQLEQDKMLFLCVCGFLALIAWAYPYFESSIKIDNDGCWEQGCIHPIIGVFGILFFPLFIHYWLYKGIKYCINLFK